jgi:hypothetical protein
MNRRTKELKDFLSKLFPMGKVPLSRQFLRQIHQEEGRGGESSRESWNIIEEVRQ